MPSLLAGFRTVLLLLGTCVTRADEPKVGTNPPARLPQIEDFAPPEEFIEIAGLKTHYIKKGDQGRVIVLLHGFGSSTYTWRLNMEELAKSHRVYAIDLKGFGLTAKPKDGNYHMGAYADQLLAFLDAMKIEKATIAGNSMGGGVALNLALRHPNRVESLVLVDAAPANFSPPGGVDIKKDEPPRKPATQSILRAVLTRALISKSMVEAGLKGAYHKPDDFVTPEMIEVYYRPTTIDGAMEALASMGSPPKTKPLPPIESLKLPVLIIWGRHDKVIPVTVADSFAKTISGSKTVILEESGHLPHEEEAVTFNRLVVEFVAELPTQPKADTPTPAKP